MSKKNFIKRLLTWDFRGNKPESNPDDKSTYPEITKDEKELIVAVEKRNYMLELESIIKSVKIN